MTARLKTFKDKNKNGFLNGNKFFFHIQIPATIIGPNSGIENLKFMCKAIDFPDSSFNTSEVFINGDYRRNAIDRDYDPIMATFYVDNSMSSWEIFNKWQNRIYNHKTRRMYWPSEYMVSNNFLEVLSNKNEVIKTIKFNKLFPQTVGSIRFDWEKQNKVTVFDVTFKYSYPEVEDL